MALRFQWAVLADRAEILPDGRANLYGAFFDFLTDRVPFTAPPCEVVAMIAADPSESERHVSLNVELLDPQNESVGTLTWGIDVRKEGVGIRSFPLVGVVFDTFGPHVLKVTNAHEPEVAYVIPLIVALGSRDRHFHGLA